MNPKSSTSLSFTRTELFHRSMHPEPSTINKRIANLIRKHLVGTLSPAEHEELAQWIEEDPINKKLFIQVGLQYREDMEMNDSCKKNIKKKTSFVSSLKKSVKRLFT